MNFLDHDAPLKKILRTNNVPYITKNLRKVIMRRSQLENFQKKDYKTSFVQSRKLW